MTVTPASIQKWQIFQKLQESLIFISAYSYSLYWAWINMYLPFLKTKKLITEMRLNVEKKKRKKIFGDYGILLLMSHSQLQVLSRV